MHGDIVLSEARAGEASVNLTISVTSRRGVQCAHKANRACVQIHRVRIQLESGKATQNTEEKSVFFTSVVVVVTSEINWFHKHKLNLVEMTPLDSTTLEAKGYREAR